MPHHLPRFLARQMEDENAKIALIVMDGLSMDQWLVVKNALAPRQPAFRFREQSVFAWISSLRSVADRFQIQVRSPGRIEFSPQ